MSGSRDVIREAFKSNIISNGERWMQMLQSRNLALHSYNETIADEIVQNIIEGYFDEFIMLEEKFESLRSGHDSQLFE